MMTIILVMNVLILAVITYFINKRVEGLYEALSVEIDFLEKLVDWKNEIDKRIETSDEIARNARNRARELEQKINRSVMYEEK